MRPLQSQGRPGTPVFPVGWEAAHAVVSEKSFDCTVSIGPATGGPMVWNPVTEQDESTAGTAVYAGPAEILVVTDTAKVMDEAADATPVRRYQVKIRAAASSVTTEHVIRVTTSSDSMLVGKTLTIDAIERGRRFSRVLQATLTR